jgi:hypothetical protein
MVLNLQNLNQFVEKTNLCKYKNIFGIPNQGVHKHRVFGYAIVDIIFTIIGAWFFSWLFKVKFWISLVGLFVVGEILHAIFCVETAFIKAIMRLL